MKSKLFEMINKIGKRQKQILKPGVIEVILPQILQILKDDKIL